MLFWGYKPFQMEETKKNNILHDIGKSIPILSLILILSGYIKIYILYFFGFKIDITSYLTISDLSLVASPDFFKIILAGIIIGPILVLGYLYAIEEIKKRNEVSKHIHIRQSMNIFYSLFTILFLSVILLIAVNDLSNKIYISFVTIFSSFFITIIFLPEKYKLTFQSYFKYTMIIFLMILMLMSVEISYTKIKKGMYNGTTIKTKSETITAGDRFIFIGKTSNYVFLVDLEDKINKIIPVSEITSIDLKVK